MVTPPMGTGMGGSPFPYRQGQYTVYPPVVTQIPLSSHTVKGTGNAVPGMRDSRDSKRTTTFGGHHSHKSNSADNNSSNSPSSFNNTKAAIWLGVLATSLAAVGCYWNHAVHKNNHSPKSPYFHSGEEDVLRSMHPHLPELLQQLSPNERQVFIEGLKNLSPEEHVALKAQLDMLIPVNPNHGLENHPSAKKLGQKALNRKVTTREAEAGGSALSGLLKMGIKAIGGMIITNQISKHVKGYLTKKGYESIHQHMILGAILPQDTLSTLAQDGMGKILKEKLSCPSWLASVTAFFVGGQLASPFISEIEDLQKGLYGLLPKAIRNPMNGAKNLVTHHVDELLRCLL